MVVGKKMYLIVHGYSFSLGELDVRKWYIPAYLQNKIKPVFERDMFKLLIDAVHSLVVILIRNLGVRLGL